MYLNAIYCIKNPTSINGISSQMYLFDVLIVQIFYRNMLKSNSFDLWNSIFFFFCKTLMYRLFVNSAVIGGAHYVPHQWGQNGRWTQSLCRANGWGRCMLGGPPHEHCPRFRCSVEILMPTVHSWQSVSSPPTTMCHWRCGEQCLNCGLNPGRSRRTLSLWSFSFKRFKCSHFCTLESRFSLRCPGMGGLGVLPTCYRSGGIQIKWKSIKGR